jgi:3'(2'), 5'-bisphosphate nucleotidase
MHDPSISLISEESGDSQMESIHASREFWIADPLDGTTEFIAGEPDYGVCLARICDGIPQIGGIALPATGVVFWGEQGVGAFRVELSESEWSSISQENVQSWVRVIRARAIRIEPSERKNGAPLRILCSRRHPDPSTSSHLSSFDGADFLMVGACVKFLYLAQGLADYYPRLAPLHEWDIAAGHAILQAAGGSMRVFGQKEDVHYGAMGFISPCFQAFAPGFSNLVI